MRPHVILEDVAHPYFTRQQNGITVAELLEIYALYGHDLRSTPSG
jgi:hypothetical protein